MSAPSKRRLADTRNSERVKIKQADRNREVAEDRLYRSLLPFRFLASLFDDPDSVVDWEVYLRSISESDLLGPVAGFIKSLMARLRYLITYSRDLDWELPEWVIPTGAPRSGLDFYSLYPTEKALNLEAFSTGSWEENSHRLDRMRDSGFLQRLLFVSTAGRFLPEPSSRLLEEAKLRFVSVCSSRPCQLTQHQLEEWERATDEVLRPLLGGDIHRITPKISLGTSASLKTSRERGGKLAEVRSFLSQSSTLSAREFWGVESLDLLNLVVDILGRPILQSTPWYLESKGITVDSPLSWYLYRLPEELVGQPDKWQVDWETSDHLGDLLVLWATRNLIRDKEIFVTDEFRPGSGLFTSPPSLQGGCILTKIGVVAEYGVKSRVINYSSLPLCILSQVLRTWIEPILERDPRYEARRCNAVLTMNRVNTATFGNDTVVAESIDLKEASDRLHPEILGVIARGFSKHLPEGHFFVRLLSVLGLHPRTLWCGAVMERQAQGTLLGDPLSFVFLSLFGVIAMQVADNRHPHLRKGEGGVVGDDLEYVASFVQASSLRRVLTETGCIISFGKNYTSWFVAFFLEECFIRREGVFELLVVPKLKHLALTGMGSRRKDDPMLGRINSLNETLCTLRDFPGECSVLIDWVDRELRPFYDLCSRRRIPIRLPGPLGGLGVLWGASFRDDLSTLPLWGLRALWELGRETCKLLVGSPMKAGWYSKYYHQSLSDFLLTHPGVSEEELFSLLELPVGDRELLTVSEFTSEVVSAQLFTMQLFQQADTPALTTLGLLLQTARRVQSQLDHSSASLPADELILAILSKFSNWAEVGQAVVRQERSELWHVSHSSEARFRPSLDVCLTRIQERSEYELVVKEEVSIFNQDRRLRPFTASELGLTVLPPIDLDVLVKQEEHRLP